MELDNLKGAWQRQTQQSAGHLLRDEELRAMLHTRAGNTIDLLKRSVRFELWFTVVFMVLCILAWFVSTNDTVRMVAVGSLIMSGGFAFYYCKKILLLNTINVENKSIKENLSNLLTQFEKYLWFYRWGYNILIPPCLLAGALAGLHASTGPEFFRLISEVKLWVVLAAILAPLAFLFNYGLKWYLRKLYGNYLARLCAILQELED